MASPARRAAGASLAAAHGPGALALVYARKAVGAAPQRLRVTWYLKNNTGEPWSEEARLRLVDEAFASDPETIPVPPARPGDVVPVQVELTMPEGDPPSVIEGELVLSGSVKPVRLPLILNQADLRVTPTPTPTSTPCAAHVCSCVGHVVCVTLCSCVTDIICKTLCVAVCPCVGDVICVALCACVAYVPCVCVAFVQPCVLLA
ncbi:MAG: hypothetical protein FJZ90_04240 [Chloroflexi bacterium]|nr:hypothetical protein [Chloroflexota bacterium]